MNVEDLKEKITKARENLNRLHTLAHSCEEGKEWIPLIERVLNWISEIEDDTANGRISDAYSQVAYNGIISLSFDHGDLDDDEILKCIKHGDVGEVNGINKHYCSLTYIQYQISSYHFYKQLGFARSNVVVVGANGCGKTTLANNLSKALNVKDGIVIPAQKLLILPSFSSIPNYDATFKEYQSYQHQILDDKETYDVSKENDFPYELTKRYGMEFKYIISILISEQVRNYNLFCKEVKEGHEPNPRQLHSKLEDVLAIWNDLIAHRTLSINENNTLLIKTDEGISYDAYKMSDGERVILYLAGRVLLAPHNSLIIVDEPEGYLHEAIINKLWDKLEYLRNDCVFIYLTHDLHFAASRRAMKFWLRDFHYPDNWEILPIEDNDIPESLLMEILGSKKDILFCEGSKDNSLDSKIYEILFPQYTIVPVETCKDVIAYTKAFNKIPNRLNNAYGIVDRDFRDRAQIEKFASENIFTTDVAEIENLFLDENFIFLFAKSKSETVNIYKIKTGIIEQLSKDIELQTSLYVSGKINYFYSEANMSKGKSKQEIASNLSKFNSNIKIEEWYKERKTYLENIVASNKYEDAIKVYNNKGLQRIVELQLGYSPMQYRKKALDFLATSEEAKEILRHDYPKELSETH